MVGSSRRRASVAVLLALLASTVLAGCGGDKQPSASPSPTSSPSSSPTDPAVVVTGTADADQVEVTGTAAGSAPGQFLYFASPIYTLSAPGSLDARATVTLRMDNPVPAGTTVLVVTREDPGSPWSYLPGRLTSDQRHVSFTTDHLSEFGALVQDVGSSVSAFKDEVRAGLVTGIDRKVTRPECQDPAGARKDGYSATSWKRKTLFWCLGLRGDTRVLTVVNRRPVPVQVARGGAATLDGPGRVPRTWVSWSGVLDGKTTFLAPGASATYDVDLDPKSLVLVSAETDQKAQSLRVLQATVAGLAARLTAFGAGRVNVAATVRSLVARRQCAKVLGQGSDALRTGCLSRGKILATLGSRGVLVTPLLAARTTPVFMRKQFKAVALDVQTKVDQHIVVRRAAPDFGAFVGSWSGHTRSLTITKTGVVVERVGDGCCHKIIDLVYQLSDPGTRNGASTATAKVTKAKVYDRKAFKNHPPKVGDTGTLRLRNGVIVTPFVKTNYCDAKAAKKGTCGA